MNTLAITITRQEAAALLPVETPASLASDEVRGRTLVSLVSPGTELACNYLSKGGNFPSNPGYAAVFEAEEIGSDVSEIKPGTRLFCSGKHRSIQQRAANSVVPVPEGLAPQEFSRDYHNTYGVSPSQNRLEGDDYQLDHPHH